jgi:hypothetical protein
MTVSRQAALHQTQDRFIVILFRSIALFHAKAKLVVAVFLQAGNN